LEVAGELDSLNRVRNIPLNFGQQGDSILLRDVAKVTKGVSFPASELAIVSDRPSVTLAVHVESATRLDLWAKETEKILAAYRQELPSAIELKTILAQSNYVEDRLNGLILNLFLGE